MQIDVLGRLRVRIPRGSVDVGGPQIRAALTWLAMQPNARVGLDAMAEAVWVRPPADAQRRVRAIVRHLAQALPAGVLEVGPPARLLLPDGAVDARRFTAAIAEAFEYWRAGEFDRARSAVAAGEDLWRGAACPDIAHTVAGAAAVRHLDDARRAGAALAQELALAGGVDFTVVADLRYQADRYPDHPVFRRQLARALARTGRHVEAVHVLRGLPGDRHADPASSALLTAVLRQDGIALAAPDPDCRYEPPAQLRPVDGARIPQARAAPDG